MLSSIYRAIAGRFPAYSSTASMSTSAAKQTDYKSFVNGEINAHTITMFFWATCPYCREARSILDKDYASVDTNYVELNRSNSTDEQIREYLQQKWKPDAYEYKPTHSLPCIFVNGHYLGGCSDLKTAVSKNGFQKLIDSPKETVA
ncbi:hypothetical protein CONPUDRAFT_149432 [Coniophora puteana RWD-64-598 SS2]|uniref:Glutaredoxin domain-containing protein n=1 Tax=Coniophora puteana (strain RWD-64-598) TaxID=741705 RepID=A0A5M3N7X6_CONPW|nr:uncharacterized protein CONPUDRAFT_149432 [Coniophora puteana RWD-64-598 SS2]EIW87398.1 hypothetical protein CONPUDRAFT_149432 [Coniophora puteana RWD-64-598 SS2]